MRVIQNFCSLRFGKLVFRAQKIDNTHYKIRFRKIKRVQAGPLLQKVITTEKISN